MARYSAADASERRTASLRSWVTPDEKDRLAAAAAREGKALSDYVRQLCLRRGGRSPVVAGVRQNPEAKLLADELRAIGINLNQLAHVANATGELSWQADLMVLTDRLAETMARVIRL